MLNGARILIVEDEPLIALDLEQAVLDGGASEVVCVAKLDDAIAAATKGTVDAAILDLRIASDSTVEVARLLWNRGIKFAFSTGDSDYAEALNEWPEAPVFLKPYNVDDIVKKLALALCYSRKNAGS